jgi:excisionase family DNA binding protein
MSAQREPDATITLHDAAEMLGVHYQTAYRWVRQGQLTAVKVAGVYRVRPDDVDELARHRSEPTPPPVRRRVRHWEPYAQRLLDRLTVGDEVGARELLEDLVDSGSTLAEVCDHVVVPSLIRIGDAWVAGEISIAGEHRASAICERAIGRLTPAPPGRPRGVALVCSPPGDDHQLPGQMATAVLREDHWRVHHLGTGVPVPDLVRMVDDERPALVVISVTWPPARTLAAELAARLELPGRRILVGRPGLTLTQLVVLARGGTPLQEVGPPSGAGGAGRAIRQAASARPRSVEGGADTHG